MIQYAAWQNKRQIAEAARTPGNQLPRTPCGQLFTILRGGPQMRLALQMWCHVADVVRPRLPSASHTCHIFLHVCRGVVEWPGGPVSSGSGAGVVIAGYYWAWYVFTQTLPYLSI